MEIVLAILLLFGGFTLGSISSENGSDEPQTSMDLPSDADAKILHPVTQAMRQSDPVRCHSDGAVIYRDLTIPYSSQTGDCEVNCPDE